MSKNGNDDQLVEELMPRLSKVAARSAYRKVLKSGNSTLIAKNGGIYRALPDGTFEFVKKTAAGIEAQKGLVIEIK